MENVARKLIANHDAFDYHWTGILVSTGLVMLLLWRLSTWKRRDEKEPSVVNTWIPYIGHVVNLFYFGQHYLEDLWYSSISFILFLCCQ